MSPVAHPRGSFWAPSSLSKRQVSGGLKVLVSTSTFPQEAVVSVFPALEGAICGSCGALGMLTRLLLSAGHADFCASLCAGTRVPLQVQWVSQSGKLSACSQESEPPLVNPEAELNCTVRGLRTQSPVLETPGWGFL